MKSLILSMVIVLSSLFAQEYVDVTFRYNAPSSPAVFLVGEFNGWNNTATPMSYAGGDVWTKTLSLQIGGNPNPPAVGVPGAWQYKFYYSGVSQWPNDPLNHHENPKDNNNTFVITKDPTIYHVLPNQKQGIIKTGTPVITAYIFPKNGASVDTASLTVTIDGISYEDIGSYYDTTSKQLVFPSPVYLTNGKHTISLYAGTTVGGVNADTVECTVQAGFVQITSQGGYTTHNPVKMLRGIVGDTSVHLAKIVRNSVDTLSVAVSNGYFTMSDSLDEGLNTFIAIVDTNGAIVVSDPFTITYYVNHTPYASATVEFSTSTHISLSAGGSTHPDGLSLSFEWFDDPATPLGLDGKTDATVMIDKPAVPGEYYFTLIAKDSSGRADTIRSLFIITDDGDYKNADYAFNPQWAKQARVYFLFPKSFTAQGTIPSAAQRLQYVKDLGFNVIWLMPVMKNAYPIDQNFGPGYNIVDFYNVAPEYGTNQDFKNFVAQAHVLGLKVILDVTPNHTSRFHPWSQEAHKFKQDSRYWDWYEHTAIPHNTNGLGQSFDGDGFNYYSGFSDQLLNYNWKDIDARTEMINVYKYWIKEFALDGFRFDVYWGPHRRYGEQYMGFPLRTALKRIKPDILLLAEDDGTGSGTETIYADYSNGGIKGGVDAAYDFKSYFNQIRNFGFSTLAIDNLHNELNNGGYYPGPNSLYMRFMESQDEDRITHNYSMSYYYDTVTTLKRTMPVATAIFSAPGFPMIWNGQEIGYGYGIGGAKEARARSTINWDFPGQFLQKHYQRLAWIRGTFKAFATQSFARIGTGDGAVYGILRQFENENAITLANIAENSRTVTIPLTISGDSPNMLFTNPQDGKIYYINDVYNDTTYQIIFSSGSADFSMDLTPFGSAMLIVSDSVRRITVPTLTSVDRRIGAESPSEYVLDQNYPNPFNPLTTVTYQIPVGTRVSLRVYDMLGRETATLVNEIQPAGSYSVQFDGTMLASGVYFYRLSAGNFQEIKRMILVK